MLEIKDLKVSFHTYSGEVQAVRGVNLRLEDGGVLAVVGESGCGKSVTAQSVLQLHDPTITQYKGGEILLDGQNLLGLSDKQMQKVRGKDVSMIFQDPMTSLNPTMTVGNQIMEVLLQHEKSAEARHPHEHRIERDRFARFRIDDRHVRQRRGDATDHGAPLARRERRVRHPPCVVEPMRLRRARHRNLHHAVQPRGFSLERLVRRFVQLKPWPLLGLHDLHIPELYRVRLVAFVPGDGHGEVRAVGFFRTAVHDAAVLEDETSARVRLGVQRDGASAAALEEAVLQDDVVFVVGDFAIYAGTAFAER